MYYGLRWNGETKGLGGLSSWSARLMKQRGGISVDTLSHVERCGVQRAHAPGIKVQICGKSCEVAGQEQASQHVHHFRGHPGVDPKGLCMGDR